MGSDNVDRRRRSDYGHATAFRPSTTRKTNQINDNNNRNPSNFNQTSNRTNNNTNSLTTNGIRNNYNSQNNRRYTNGNGEAQASRRSANTPNANNAAPPAVNNQHETTGNPSRYSRPETSGDQTHRQHQSQFNQRPIQPRAAFMTTQAPLRGRSVSGGKLKRVDDSKHVAPPSSPKAHIARTMATLSFKLDHQKKVVLTLGKSSLTFLPNQSNY